MLACHPIHRQSEPRKSLHSPPSAPSLKSRKSTIWRSWLKIRLDPNARAERTTVLWMTTVLRMTARVRKTSLTGAHPTPPPPMRQRPALAGRCRVLRIRDRGAWRVHKRRPACTSLAESLLAVNATRALRRGSNVSLSVSRGEDNHVAALVPSWTRIVALANVTRKTKSTAFVARRIIRFASGILKLQS